MTLPSTNSRGAAASVPKAVKRIMLVLRPILSESAPNAGCISMKTIKTIVITKVTVLASICAVFTRYFCM